MSESIQITECIQPDGTVVYTNRGCEQGESQQVGLTPEMAVAPVSSQFEISMHSISLSVLLPLVYLVMSAITYLVYRVDKKRAIKDEQRIPEATLHWMELLGGWPGAFLAQRIIRHKNRKVPYQVWFWLIVSLHVFVWTDYFLGLGVLTALGRIGGQVLI